MGSELAKTTAAVMGVLFVGATVAVGWSYVEPLEQPEDTVVSVGEYEGVRVFFETVETRMTTVDQGLPNDGEIVFQPLGVPLANVTRVTVTLNADVDGIALNDQFEVRVRSPDGGEKEGVWSGPLLNPSGYRSSVIIIPEWQRAPRPEESTYPTTDSDEALGMSAENHTHHGSVGDWEAEVSMSTPGLSRTGNVSLSFTFVHYEALAVLELEERGAQRACPEDNTTMASGSGCPSEEAARERPADGGGRREAKEEPRTFITRAGVARSVDRDPGPHGPL